MTVLQMPGIKYPPKSTPREHRSEMDTLLLTRSGISSWKLPPFQREFRLTDKVKKISAEIKESRGCIPGVITLGKLDGDTYLLDGQHRIEAFKLTELVEGLADVRIKYFDDMADMAEEFIEINSALVRMRNDDFLRGMEQSNEHLGAIRRRCSFIGYDHIRQGHNPRTMISMAQVLRNWNGSKGETPSHGDDTLSCAKALDSKTVKEVCDFMGACFEAWRNDKIHHRLWSGLNLTILMWIWRRTVLGEGRTEAKRWAKLDREQFIKCMMALAVDPHYIEFLRGRVMGDLHRSATYTRMKAIFVRRLGEAGIKQVRFPQEDWVK